MPNGAITTESVNGGRWRVDVPLKFRVENDKGEWISGEVTQTLLVNTSTDPWQIISENGEVTKREKGGPNSKTRKSPTDKIPSLASTRPSAAGTWAGTVQTKTLWGANKGRIEKNVQQFTINSDETSISFLRGSTVALRRNGDIVTWSFSKENRGSFRVNDEGAAGLLSYQSKGSKTDEVILVATGTLHKK